MAKLSLWLLTVAKDKPFEFLDHSIRCGDSLVGLHSIEQLRHFSLKPDADDAVLFKGPLDNAVDEAIDLRLKLEDMLANTVEDVQRQEKLLNEANENIARLRCAADLLVAAEFWGENAKDKLERVRHAAVKSGHYFEQGPTNEFEQVAAEQRRGQAMFHWPLEFPEVITKRRGFDAFIGNPPFKRGKDISGLLGNRYREFVVSIVANGARGSADLVTYFFLVAFNLLRSLGTFGLLGTNTISEGDTREVGLDRLIDAEGDIFNAVPDFNWPGDASLMVSLVHLYKGKWKGSRLLSGSQVQNITPLLNEENHWTPSKLLSNRSLSYQGTNILGLGFTMSPSEAQALLSRGEATKVVLSGYLGGKDVTDSPTCAPSRWAINFWDWPLDRHSCPKRYVGPAASDYPTLLRLVKEKVKPERDNKKRKQYRELWWQFGEKQKALYKAIGRGEGFVDGVSNERPSWVLVQVMIAKYIAPVVVPNDQIFSHRLVVFTSEPFTTLATVQSTIHQEWVYEFGGTLETRMSYTPSDSFETFPLPADSTGLYEIGKHYSTRRSEGMLERQCGITEFYNLFNAPEETSSTFSELREAQLKLDYVLASCYGWKSLDLCHGFRETKKGIRFTISEPARREVLQRLLKLNHERYAEEVKQGLHSKKKGAAKEAAPNKKAASKPAKQEANLFGDEDDA
jgi:hypothetical protein